MYLEEVPCPRCGSDNTRRVRRTRLEKSLSGVRRNRAYLCRSCDNRFRVWGDGKRPDKVQARTVSEPPQV